MSPPCEPGCACQCHAADDVPPAAYVRQVILQDVLRMPGIELSALQAAVTERLASVTVELTEQELRRWDVMKRWTSEMIASLQLDGFIYVTGEARVRAWESNRLPGRHRWHAWDHDDELSITDQLAFVDEQLGK